MERDDEEELEQIRENTKQGSVIGPMAFIEELQDLFSRNLLSRPRGRPQDKGK